MKKTGLILFIGYMGVILLLHLVPTGWLVQDAAPLFRDIEYDMIVHFFLFLPWMAAASLFLNHRDCSGSRAFSIGWLAAGLIVAAGAETVHFFIDYRVFNPADMGMNMAGVCAGWIFRNVFISPKKY